MKRSDHCLCLHSRQVGFSNLSEAGLSQVLRVETEGIPHEAKRLEQGTHLASLARLNDA